MLAQPLSLLEARLLSASFALSRRGALLLRQRRSNRAHARQSCKFTISGCRSFTARTQLHTSPQTYGSGFYAVATGGATTTPTRSAFTKCPVVQQRHYGAAADREFLPATSNAPAQQARGQKASQTLAPRAPRGLLPQPSTAGEQCASAPTAAVVTARQVRCFPAFPIWDVRVDTCRYQSVSVQRWRLTNAIHVHQRGNASHRQAAVFTGSYRNTRVYTCAGARPQPCTRHYCRRPTGRCTADHPVRRRPWPRRRQRQQLLFRGVRVPGRSHAAAAAAATGRKSWRPRCSQYRGCGAGVQRHGCAAAAALVRQRRLLGPHGAAAQSGHRQGRQVPYVLRPRPNPAIGLPPSDDLSSEIRPKARSLSLH